jgi:ribose transport system ATP-binding protein
VKPLLRLERIEKSFPGVKALSGVSLELHAGEVLALVGENGAGKSTLIKVLAGAHRPDAGTIRIGDSFAPINGPADAQRSGVAVIYQEFNLVPALSARENIFLGREVTRAGFICAHREYHAAEQLFARLGIAIDPDAACRSLTIAQQQGVEIAKALSLNARILVMDEPSATLTSTEVERLFAIIRDLKALGMGILYVSHRLEEILHIADRVMVLRDGQHVATEPIRQVTRAKLIELMVGRKLDQEFPTRQVVIGEERLVVKNLGRGNKVRDVSFAIRSGEVLGLTGLVGSGRTETARLVFGADRRDAGSIALDGRQLNIRNPADAIRAGVGLLTEDRKTQGLVLDCPARENFALPNLFRYSHWGFLRPRRERRAFKCYVDDLAIKISDDEQLVKNLSGGNQQKVILAKWLERNCEVIIFDEPTRGIDVGAKYEVYKLINKLAAHGKAILIISSELPEVLGMSDRILVMRQGRIAGEITNVAQATQQEIMTLAVGGAN